MGETISEAISADHHSFDVYYENIKNAEDDAGKVRWRNQLTWTLARHAISEELTLYPAMEKHLGAMGVELSKTDKEQHQGVRALEPMNEIKKQEAYLSSLRTGQRISLRDPRHDSHRPQILA